MVGFDLAIKVSEFLKKILMMENAANPEAKGVLHDELILEYHRFLGEGLVDKAEAFVLQSSEIQGLEKPGAHFPLAEILELLGTGRLGCIGGGDSGQTRTLIGRGKGSGCKSPQEVKHE